MKITYWELENYRTVKGNWVVPINPDSTIHLISGSNNGTGKTSLIRNYAVMMFNNTLGTLEDEINWDSDYFKSEIHFEHLGVTYQNKMKYEKSGKTGKSTRELICSNCEKPFLNSDAVKKLAEIFDPALCLASSISFQDEDNVVTGKPAQRRELLKKVRDLDFKKQAKEVEDEYKSLQVNLSVLEKEIEFLEKQDYTEEVEKPLPFTQEEVEFKKLEIVNLQKAIADLKVKVSSGEQNKKAYDDYCKKLKTVKDEITLLTDSISTLTTGLTKAKETLETKKAQTNSEKATIESLNNSLVIKRIASFDDSLIETLVSEISGITSEGKQYREKLELCKTGKCPTCANPFDSKDIPLYEQKILELTQLYTAKAQALQATKEVKKAIDQEIEDNNKNKTKKEQYKNDLVLIDTKLLQLEESYTYKKEQDENQIKEKNISLESKKTELQSLEANPIAPPLDVSQYTSEIETLEFKIFQVQKGIDSYNAVVMGNQTIQEMNKKIQKNKETNLKQIEEKKVSLEDVRTYIEDLKKVREILLKEFPSFVISKMIKFLEIEMNKFIDDVYYKPLNIVIKEESDAIDILYGTGKRQIDVVHASGAEKQLMSLAYKHALNQFSGNDILFLDEIDSNLKEENALFLCDMVAELSMHYSQVFPISHCEAVKSRYVGQHQSEIIQVKETME